MVGEKQKELDFKLRIIGRRDKTMKRKFAMLGIYVAGGILSIMVVLILFGPVLIWNNLPATPLNVWIVDKTVPVPDYREHKGLMWLLNHNKIVSEKTGETFSYDKDYFGFFPVNKDLYDIWEIPDIKENPDLIYLTDTYGVYADDYKVPKVEGTRPDLLYGGLEKDELVKIINNIGNGNTLIGEFNIASSPTNIENRGELEFIFGVNWSGWKGRYFKDLAKDFEVPTWVVVNYEEQENKAWPYKGSGYVLVSEEDKIVILENKKHIGSKGLSVKFEGDYKSEFNVRKSIPYQYWFEFLEVDEDAETIANYYFDLTDDGNEVLNELGLPSVFPAVIRKVNSEYTSYYFCGDYADLEKVASNWNYYGFQGIKRFTSSANKKSPDYFYWNAYAPMMTKIIGDVGYKKENPDTTEIPNNPYISKVEGKDFYILSEGEWKKTFLKGVNMGVAHPGTFPGELAITKGEYLRWFKYISEMNAEVIRVYTTLKPDFYDALYLYNKTAIKPLYLIQGVWVKEEDIAELSDAYKDKERILNEFIKDASDLTDVLHGNAKLPEKKGFASGEYKSDISKYVIGWILGIEWDPYFVDGTNTNNPDKKTYEGKYLYTEDASPFEAFLCHVGDKTIEYEVDKYGTERPVSFSNWPTTDMLDHPNEPAEKEDFASVNMEHIKAKEIFKSGVFASYHIYPYYPEFMNYEKEYVNFKDSDGQINTYKAYLRDLMKHHTMPVLVAEFGVPAARGMAHLNIHMGYNQGYHDEKDQGIIVEKLLKDIYDEGYCGGLVFTWQDEWFKRTWNTMDFDLPDRRPFWSNPQTNEQEFGLLAFDPGRETICDVDGDVSEWKGDIPTYTGKDVKLYVKSDEKYFYMMADTKNFNFEKDTIIIPIDTTDGQGNVRDISSKLNFSRPADFTIRINGANNSRVLIDSYYDSFQYLYGELLQMVPKKLSHKQKGSGVFDPIYLCLSAKLILPQDKTVVPFMKYETGVLQYGNSNPNHKDYNSLSDFCEKDGKVEIRIPWQLLNVMDPSTKSVMNDFHQTKDFSGHEVEGLYLGAGIISKIKTDEVIGMNFYSWEDWEAPTFHERLKPSYYIMQKAFERIK